MSLVERALKKLQESRGTPEPPAPRAPASSGIALPSSTPATPRPDVPRPTRTAHVDRALLQSLELLPSAEQERLLAHDFRQIKRALIGNAFGRGSPAIPLGRAIMIASALPGDGKTFTSLNLALSLALEKDSSVLLVDADVAKPHISRIFDVASEPGLLDVLRDESVDIDSVVLPSDVPNLSILPAGRASDTANELLASNRMQKLVAELEMRDPNRIVLFDSPPLLLTSESLSLAACVGQVVLIVRAGVTPRQAVQDALDLLPENKFIGLILNQSVDRLNAGYAQYYGQRGEGSA